MLTNLRHLFFVFFLLSLGIQCQAMTFSIENRCFKELMPNCQNMIFAQGIINTATVKEFKEVSAKLPVGTYLVFSSPGGDLIAGLQLGLAIREKGFNTIIAGDDFAPPRCLSSCAYAFLGGVQRRIPPESKLGLHQFRGHDQELSAYDSQKVLAVIMKYLDKMGVDRRFEDVALQTSSDKISFITSEQAKLWQVEFTGQTNSPRWRMEATPQGKLMLINTLKTTQGQLLNFGFIKTAPQTIFSMIFYPSQDPVSFATRINHQLHVQGQVFDLVQVSNWQEVGQGYQGIFTIPPQALSLLLSLSDDATFSLRARFIKAPKPSTNENIEANIGTVALKNGLVELIQ
jgi:hypothetical protein